MNKRRVGNLECIEVLNETDTALPWVILFHGFGADCHDLATLADYIPDSSKYNWLFPNGIVGADMGGGWTQGRAWWQIDILALQVAMSRGESRDMSQLIPEGLKKARDEAFKGIAQLGVAWDQIVLGGFSQGSMLAVDLYFNAPQTPKGLIIYSGTALALNTYEPLTSARAGQKFFQSHGKSDAVLGHKEAQKLEGFLTNHGLKGQMLSFSGGHEIPPAVLQGTGKYLGTI
jgi:phospholipase/carboxylesterase